jgi:hypothetical protein
MATDKLKALLGDEGLAELLALMQPPPPPPSALSPIITGIMKSWTIWAGTLMVALPQLQPLIMPQLEQQYPGGAKWVMTAFGVITLLLRIKTTQSLTAKGSPPGQATTA